MDNKLKAIGFALSNAGLEQDIEAEVKINNPGYNNVQIKAAVVAQQNLLTLYCDLNKRAKKVK